MNLLKLTDEKLATLRQDVVNECGRRTRAAVEGLDPGQLVYGNELAKRAVVVAAAGKHSLLLLGPRNCGKTMLRAVGYALGLEEVFEFLPCPCGEYSDPMRACRCTITQMTRHLSKLPAAEISVEVFRPGERELRSLGSSLADMQRQLAEAIPFEHVSMILPETCRTQSVEAQKAACRLTWISSMTAEPIREGFAMDQGTLDLGSTNFEIAEQIAEAIDRAATDPKDRRAVTATVIHTLLEHPHVEDELRNNLVRGVAGILKLAVTKEEVEVTDDG